MRSGIHDQRGGIMAFLLVGVVLALLLAGGIYVSKNQGRQAALNPATGPSATSSEKTDAPATDQTPQKKPAEEQKTPAQTPAQPTPAQPQPTKPSTQTPPAGQQPLATTGPGSIASTGPGDALVSALALGAVTAGIIAYRRSLTQMRGAALK